MGSSSEISRTPPGEKTAVTSQIENVKTNERVPGRPGYDEKDGLRTYGDDEDHDHEPPVRQKPMFPFQSTRLTRVSQMTFKRMMSLIAMAFLWTGSQIPVYIFGGIPPLIYGDIGGTDRWTWFVLANLLALAAVCPFVGSLSDLMGRRYVAIMGAVLIIVGVTIASTAHTMNIFIGKFSTINLRMHDHLLTIAAGMAIAGAGAGINELTALAVTSELAPTRKRGKYVAILVFTIVPFCPSVLWAQLIAAHGGWRYCGVLCGVWAAIGLIMTIIFYFPPPRVNSKGLTKKEIIMQIDYVGGFLSITGMLVFMAALQWGGYQVWPTFVDD